MSLAIRFFDPIKEVERLPWELLLDADPNRDLVTAYLKQSVVLVAFDSENPDKLLGVLVFQERLKEWEILNVAVAPACQNQGIGKRLLQACLREIKKRQDQKRILIKTGDLTSPALTLYQKMGFKQIAFIKDYFVENYPEPIYEEGEQLRNQVILAYTPLSTCS